MTKRKMPGGEDYYKDMYAPYSPEKRGDLLEYLKSCDQNNADNFFSGPEYFKKIVELNIVSPGYTTIRVNLSPAPDAVYFINEQFVLESRGQGNYNMSAMTAKEGVYEPGVILKNKTWSINGLKL
jgi:hypothetical protein